MIAAGLIGCRTEHRTTPRGAESAVLSPFPAAEAWVVRQGGELVGSVVRFEAPGNPGRFLFSVRNRWNQDIGFVDAEGRAWRRVPHRDDEWIGTGTVPDGARQILGLDPQSELAPVPILELETIVRDTRPARRDE